MRRLLKRMTSFFRCQMRGHQLHFSKCVNLNVKSACSKCIPSAVMQACIFLRHSLHGESLADQDHCTPQRAAADP